MGGNYLLGMGDESATRELAPGLRYLREDAWDGISFAGLGPSHMFPMQLAHAGTHVVLIGDHMQLAPLVLSPTTQFKGLGTSMFQRLM